MIGAIAGDIIGSRLEKVYIQTNKPDENWQTIPLFVDECSFTDDTLLSCAIAKSIMRELPYMEVLKDFGKRYPNSGFGSSFKKWMFMEDNEQNNSFGNGASMRVSPIGFIFDTFEGDDKVNTIGRLFVLDLILLEAKKSALPTHNSEEGIKGAQAIATSIYMARCKQTKQQIKDYITAKFGYNLDRTLDSIRPTYIFTSNAQYSVPEAIICFLEGYDYESTIRLALSLGGDVDTIACMSGGIAEGFYGVDSIPIEIIDNARRILKEQAPELDEIVTEFIEQHIAQYDTGRNKN